MEEGDVTKLEEAVTGGEAPAQQNGPRHPRTMIGDLEGEVSREEYTTFPTPFDLDILEKIKTAAVAQFRHAK